jgi:NAD(P)-dependent dehydrogenase (short-subunit alcohol dehydrogenase family)
MEKMNESSSYITPRTDRLRGKVALITGSAQGIGEGHAKIFARAGAKIVVADIQEDRGQRVAESIAADDAEAIFVPLDITNQDSWCKAIDATLSKFGQLTTLVNNAAIYFANKLEEETKESWDRMILFDQTSVFFGMQAALPALERSGNGAIVNISSNAGLIPQFSCFSYHAAKAAVRMMSNTAALEYATRNVRINSIYPGWIETPMHAHLRPDELEASRNAIPMKKPGYPHDIALASLFLCSDEARYITGAELSVDGGFH